MSKNKNKNNNNQNRNQQIKQQPILSKPTTIDDIKSATSESEFLKKKDELLNQLLEEISEYEKEKKEAENRAITAKSALDDINKRLEDAKTDRADVLAALTEAKAELTKAQKAAESAQKEVENAEEKAKGILDEAEKQKLEIIANASNEARSSWKKQVDDLTNQLGEIAKRETELEAKKIDVLKQKQGVEMQQEELAEMQEFVKRQKEKYLSASPLAIESIQRELDEEKIKYEALAEKHKEQTIRLVEIQTTLDSIKVEVGDISGAKKSSTVGALIAQLKELKDRYDSLSLIHSKYPDEDSIKPIEEKAQKYEQLEQSYESLELDRNRYRNEVTAAQQAIKELEVVKQEVDATNALNEHLLKELESHKTALESRTGDTCPALTKVDTECIEEKFIREINEKKSRQTLSSLKDIVSHVRNYAGCQKEENKLFYDANDIRAFLAGMAVSRLIILQGMSGTGKSSLPRIFAEAISGYNRLIPVESSWRDKNELLGYYNDFNKKFNAKTFTIELYRSGKERCQNIPTFIVLDEMNLARIEYYFSDFLSILQETDKNKWLIELVASDMRTLPMELPGDIKSKMKNESPTIYATWDKIEKSRKGDLNVETTEDEKAELTTYLSKLGRLTGAKDLIDGRKIRVTDNIWFIGTANKDESTFEITDKVYDRAQVVSLNKKGKDEKNYESRQKMFISVSELTSMFEKAIQQNPNRVNIKQRLDEIDDFIVEKFDTSFGNRIERQTMDFVAVFVAAGGKVEDAMDYQISTKILRKIITSDDGESLLELLEYTKDYKETTRLINKRIKELR